MVKASALSPRILPLDNSYARVTTQPQCWANTAYSPPGRGPRQAVAAKINLRFFARLAFAAGKNVGRGATQFANVALDTVADASVTRLRQARRAGLQESFAQLDHVDLLPPRFFRLQILSKVNTFVFVEEEPWIKDPCATIGEFTERERQDLTIAGATVSGNRREI